LRNLEETGLTLAYVVREEVGLPAIDLGFGTLDYAQEMIIRCNHATAAH
jgi:hypothetical protein